MVRSTFEQVGISILSEGAIDGPTIDAKKYIDQHYYAIASKATIMKPSELNVPADKFEEKFGETWESVLASGKVLNALDACAHLGCDAEQLDAAWAASKKAKKLVKFGGGFYCAHVTVGEKSIYTLNGFFMSTPVSSVLSAHQRQADRGRQIDRSRRTTEGTAPGRRPVDVFEVRSS